ncbi:MAG: formylglycine-generating enzyme family protein, partial [Verrucomicrobia bacterium]|nr:formylglycine-generating enzyme family protein [Verrucomicrobiota bacterium]
MEKQVYKNMIANKLMTGFLGLALAAAMAQAEGPTISFKKDGENFIVTYTGELYQSTDAVKWTAVPGATSPYQVKTGDKQLFFCAKGDAGNKNYTIPLADGVDLDMIWIKPGTFIMGSPEDELGRGNDEPQHEVTLTRGYWIGKYEVTQAQYKAVMGNNPSQFQGDDQRPVETVSFYNAIDFCSRLTAIEKAAGRLPEGYEYTLPTEAQWEYACRAGTTTALNNGMDLSDKWDSPEIEELAWCTMNSDSTTHPVGLKKPNNWGLYDMHGNLLEWCLDWYDFYPTEPVTDPTGPSRGLYHVIRGGSWNFAPFCCRSAYRSEYNGTYGVYFCGFRVTVSESKNITIPLSDTVNLDMIRIEPGSFRMGSPEDELGRWDDETQHQVTLTKGYWLGKYEVTQAQYEAVMGTNPSNWKGADLPVEQVSWYDATNFCAKLTAIEKTAGRLPEGYEYTLPTEAQWEYACRAGTRSALNSGKDLSNSEESPDEYKCPEMDEVGWYWYNSGNKTHSVGQKQPNAWGLYDMHGNVFEWCLDWWGDYPTSSVTDPKGASTGSYRVMRGGCLNRDADRCRSASRLDDSPDDYFIDRGFRVALSFCGKESENKDMTIPLSEDVNMDMIWIEPGTFMMGSPEDENGRDYNETQHEVTLTRGY